MSLHDKPHLNAARRRARKRTLARRDGARCAYCRRPFADLRKATMDHIVPISLFRTWSADHLVLACRPCNNRKADRLPLSIALLLCAYADRSRPTSRPVNLTVGAVFTAFTADADSVHGVHGTLTGPVGYAGWLAMARIVAVNESAARSMPGLHESTPGEQPHAPDHAPAPCGDSGERARPAGSTGRPDCLRAPAPVRVCPTVGEVAA